MPFGIPCLLCSVSIMAFLCSQTSCGVSVSTFFFSLLVLLSLQCHIASSALMLKTRHHHHNHQRIPSSTVQANSTCALFVGTWVHDETYPLYQPSSCSIIDPEFNCQMYGRPDSDYLKYRWKPLNCELPRYNSSMWDLSFSQRHNNKRLCPKIVS